MKVDILAIGIHPDDVELSCSGTILRQISLGKTVAILDLTAGELGTRGTPEVRVQEAETASEILGIADRKHLGLEDGFFELSKENKLEIVRALRHYQPEIVLSNAVEDRHPDHGRAARLIYDACFLAGLLKIETKGYQSETQDRWRPQAIYNYIQDKTLQADLIVDITPFIEKKMDSILAFRSQFFDPNSSEASSPISGEDFLKFIRAKARTYGRQIGVEYGEGFTVPRPVGTRDLFGLI